MRARGYALNVAFESPDQAMILALVEQGLGIGITSAAPVRTTHAKVRTLEVGDANVACSLALAWRERGGRSGILSAFLEFVRHWNWQT